MQRKLSEQTIIQKKISLVNFKKAGVLSEQDWEKSADGLALLEREKAYALEARLSDMQAKRLAAGPKDHLKNFRRTFMQLYTASKTGLGIATSVGERDLKEQGKFRKDLIAAYQSAHPEERTDALWCPIVNDWVLSEHVKAAHIFSHAQGTSMFRSIFGLEDSLSSINNGIIMSSSAEQKFDKGFFVIVPLVVDETSPAAIETWIKSEPKRYKMRVINPEGAKMGNYLTPSSKTTWNDLDGRELIFRGKHRPRARYLYWHYCQSILRRSWMNQKATTALKDELGNPYWETPGPFMRKQMLLAFVEELGHPYNGLMDGAEEDGTDEAVETALFAANHGILESIKESDTGMAYGIEDSDSEDDDDELAM